MDATDPTKHSVNGSVASTCAGGPCPGDLVGSFHYDSYQFTNPSAASVCVTVSYNQTCLYSDAYLSTFDPANGCTNYLGAAGAAGPTSYSFTVPGNATFWVVAEEYNINAGCANYTLTLTGLPVGCPSPTPTIPATPTATNTRTNTATPTIPATPTPTNTRTNTATPTIPVTPTPTTTPTATCTPVMQGHLTYQGLAQPNAGNVQPFTLQLQPTGGGSVSTFNTSTDTNGAFSLGLGALAPGTYNYWIKGTRYLAASGTLTLTGSCTSPQEFGIQRAGDINNDNCVAVTDFTLLRTSFGTACGDPSFNATADYNNDCVVDTTDFTLLRSNFGICGASPLTLAPAKP